MASPFAFFRKNQRAWMAALVIVSIVTFVIVPSIQSYVQPNGGAVRQNNQTLVSWKGGRLTADRLEKLQMVHAQTYRIFSQMAAEVVQAGGTPNVPGFSMSPQGMEIGIEQPTNIQSVLQVRLFAEAAKKRGIVVDDRTVDQFIRNFSDNKIAQKRLDEIRREVAGDSLTKFDMYDFLRDEIAKQILVQLGYAGLAVSQQSLISPSKNWMNFQKFQQRAKIEAYPVFVDQFLEKVTAKPSDQELRTLYGKAKDLLPQPNNPEPGFRRPYRANVEFLLADLNTFLKDEEAKLGEDLLKATYEKRVADEGAYKVPIEEPKSAEPGSEGKAAEKPLDPQASEAPAADKAPAAPAVDEAAAKSEDAPAQAAAPAADEPVSEPVPAPVEPAVKESVPEAAKEPALPELSSRPASIRPGLRLVAFQNESSEKSAVENPIDPPSTPSPAESTAPVANEVVAEITTAAEATTAAETAAAPALDSAQPPATAPEADKPMRVRSFEEVREELRRELALKPAQDKMNASIAAAQEILDQYYNQLQLFKTADPNNPDTLEPSLPVLPKLADQFGLTYGKTGLVDSFSVEPLPIGRSFTNFGGGQSGGGYNFDMFSRSVFNNRLQLFQAATSQGFGGGTSQTFLFWKIEEANSRVPPFDEVREEVVKAWKLGEARKLAMKTAEELAGSINTTTDADPWARVLEPSLQSLVLKPPMFTWLQPMLTGNEGIQLSTVEGIDQPGQLFMERAFATPIGKASVALDAAQQKCFVIRVLERNPSDEQLRIEFEKAPLNRGVVSLAMQQTSISASRWFDSLVEELDVDMSNLAGNEAMPEE